MVTILGLLFAHGIVVNLSSSRHLRPQQLRVSETFVAAGAFCDLVPGSLSKVFFAYAAWKEPNPDAGRLLAGDTIEPSKLKALSPVYQKLAEYRKSPSQVLSADLQALGYAGLYKILLCLLPVCGLVVTSILILLLLPETEESPPEPGLESATSPLPGALAIPLGWGVFNLFALPWIATHLPATSQDLHRLTVWGLSYASLLACLFVAYWKGDFRPSFRLALRASAAGYLQVLVAVNAMELLLRLLTGIDVDRYTFDPGALSGWQPLGLAGFLVLALAVGPLAEELCYRGWLLKKSLPSLGAHGALALSSGVFALAHGNLWAVPGLFVFSWVVGRVYLQERSVAATFVIHAAWNATSLCLGYLAL